MTDEVKTISERLRIEADDLQFPTDTADEGSLNLAGIIHKAADLLEAEHARAEAAEAKLALLERRVEEMQATHAYSSDWQFTAFDETLKLAREKRMQGDGDLGLAHLEDMYRRLDRSMKPAKVGRWLGWAQAAVHSAGVMTLDEMKSINKHCSDTINTNAQEDDVGLTHRHRERGTEYVLIGYGRMQAQNWWKCATGFDPRGAAAASFVKADMREVAIYRSATDPTEVWVRPREEFEGGRFEVLK